MAYDATTHCVAFVGHRLLAFGALIEIAEAAKLESEKNPTQMAMVFDAASGAPIDLDLRGSVAEVLARLTWPRPKSRGRPKLGVVAREVTLMPRHWEWLSAQPGGASVALRKLVEDARKSGSGAANLRQGQTALYKFMAAIAGDFPDYEEATRALFAGDKSRFLGLIEAWPIDIQTHINHLAETAFPAS